jgi:hypothetical protein
MKTERIKERFFSAAENFRLLETKEERLLIILSVARFFSFIGGLIFIWLAFAESIPAGLIVIFVFSALFFLLLKLYSDHSARKEFLRNLAIINQNEGNALSGDLSAFEAGSSYTDTDHDFSNDVDSYRLRTRYPFRMAVRSLFSFSGNDLTSGSY